MPQDQVATHKSTRKAIYATGPDGAYEIVASSGWEVEAAATLQAVAELARLATAAYDRVAAGEMAPLYYYLFAKRMDLDILSQSSGIAKWRLKRHLKPGIFAKLPAKIVARYAEALGLELEELYRLPERVSNRD